MKESLRTHASNISENHLRFLESLAQQTRRLTDPVKVLDITARMLGEHLGATCCVYAEVASDSTIEVRDEWCTPGVARMAGTTTLDLFGVAGKAQLRAGHAVVERDTDAMPGARAFICAPLIHEQTLSAMWCVQQNTPRDWQPDEISLVETVADNSWAHVAHMRAAMALREAQANMKVAVAAAKLGQWNLDLRTGEMVASNGCKANFGRQPDEPFTYEDLHATIHPDDRPRVLALIHTAIEKRADYDAEYRIIWPDGTPHSVMARGRATYLPDGTPATMSGVTLDITERNRVEEMKEEGERERQRLMTELKDHNRRKDEFLAMLGHELRNPLAPMFNAVAMLHSQTTDNPIHRQAHGIIDRQLGQLKHLVDDLLEVSRITTGRVQLRHEVVAIGSIVDHAVETTRATMYRMSHDVTVSVPDEPVYVYGDAARLEQVLVNLLNNAAKYTPEGGQIWVTVTQEGEQVAVRVRDTGIGISEDLLPHVFDLFTQAEKSLARSEGGLGIGLALVKRLVELHGGRVEAASEAGEGSEFTVWLPVSRAEAEAAVPEAARTESAGGRRVLVVDDNVDSAESMAQLLRLSDFEVRTAHDGPEAIEMAEDWKPHAVLLDIGLPSMSGYDVAREMRKSPELVGMRLVALTGYGQSGDREKTRDAGFDQHLVKPADLDQLQRALGPNA